MAQELAATAGSERDVRVEDNNMAAQNLAELQKDYEHFAYIVSHDLQEPIRSVVSFTQLLQEKYAEELNDNAQRYLYYAADGARRLQDMVSGLLEYSRVSTQGEAFAEVNLNAVLESIIQRLSLEFDCKCINIMSRELPTIMGDGIQLRRLFYNLLHNALFFNQEVAELRIDVRAQAQERGWCFDISDNGVAIPAKMAKTIFAPFQHHHPASSVRSAGMGLAIARRIVQRHGGEIWLQQYENADKTFFFVIPYVPEADISPHSGAANDS